MDYALIIAGPSAVGKTTVASLMQEYGFQIVRSATTREPRGDGMDEEYIYLSKDEFVKRVALGEMLEYTEYGGNFYGTPKSEIVRVIKSGKTPILILDIKGVVSIKTSRFDFGTVAVYLWDIPSVIEERLYLRYGGEVASQSKLKSRLEENKRYSVEILENAAYFDAFIRNDKTAEETAHLLYEEFLNIINSGIQKNALIPEELK